MNVSPFSTKESNFLYVLDHIGVLGHSTVNTAIHQAFSGHRIGRCKIDVGRLLQKGYFEVKLLRHSLRRRMGIARPNDVLDVQTLLLPGLPDADLSTSRQTNVLKCGLLDSMDLLSAAIIFIKQLYNFIMSRR